MVVGEGYLGEHWYQEGTWVAPGRWGYGGGYLGEVPERVGGRWYYGKGIYQVGGIRRVLGGSTRKG